MPETKFILIGGKPGKASDQGRALCQEALKNVTQPVKVLFCLFAVDPERRAGTYHLLCNRFQSSYPEQKINFSEAQSKNFIGQLQQSDVIYIDGGRIESLETALKDQIGWLEVLAGKTVVANSGGADILMQSYYYLAARKTCNGLGLLPYKFIPHWQAYASFPDVDFVQALSELQSFGTDLPIIKLREGEFKIIYK